MKTVTFLIAVVCLMMAGCATVRQVRQQDLDAWVGMPVEALDTHSLFLTVPMYRTVSSSGIEIRNYANGADVARCFGSGSAYAGGGRTVNATTFSTCTSNRVVCNNIFYVKDGKVLEYAPTGQCYTDDSVRPQKRYLNLQAVK